MMVILQSWRFGWLWFIDNDGDTTIMKVRLIIVIDMIMILQSGKFG